MTSQSTTLATSVDADLPQVEVPRQARDGWKQQVVRGLLALMDQGFVSLNTFVTIILVARLCGQSDLNLYALAWSILNIFRVIQERLLGAPYVVFAHEEGRDSRSFLGSSLRQQFLFSLTTMCLFLLMGIGFSFYDVPSGMSICMFLLSVITPLVLLRDHLRIVSCAHFGYVTAMLLSGAALGIQLLLMFAAWRMGMLNVLVVFAAMGIASLLPALAWFLFRPLPFRYDASGASQDWRDVFQYSRWLVAARIFPTAAACLLPWVALWMINEDASGLLASCITLSNVSLIFVTGANNFFQPRAVRAFHRSGPPALCKILLQSLIVFLIVLSGLCVVYFQAGDWLMERIFRLEFANGGMVVGILGLYTLIVSVSIVAGNGMAALSQPKGVFWGEVAFSIVTIAVAVALAPAFQLTGIAIALVAGSIVSTVIAGGFFLSLLRQENHRRADVSHQRDASLSMEATIG